MVEKKIGNATAGRIAVTGSAGLVSADGVSPLRSAAGTSLRQSFAGRSLRHLVGPRWPGSAQFAALASFIAAVNKTGLGAPTFDAVASFFAAPGKATRFGAPTFDAEAAFTAAGRKVAFGSAQFNAEAAFVADGQIPVTSIVLFDTAVSTGQTITAPDDILAGDIIVMAQMARTAGSVPTAVLPTDFAYIGNNDNGSNARSSLVYKLAVGTEGGTSITGLNGGAVNAKAMAVFRPDVPATTLTLGGQVAVVDVGDPAAQNITAGAGIPPLLVAALYSANGNVSPRTMSPAKDAELSSTDELWLAWKIYDTSPANVSIDMDDEGAANTLIGGYLAAE